MKGIKITDGNVLVSFDVVNCFGNIPTELALQIIEKDFRRPHTNPEGEVHSIARRLPDSKRIISSVTVGTTGKTKECLWARH